MRTIRFAQLSTSANATHVAEEGSTRLERPFHASRGKERCERVGVD